MPSKQSVQRDWPLQRRQRASPSWSEPEDLLDELSRNTGAKQDGSDHPIEQVFDLGHALFASVERMIDLLVTLGADGFMDG